MASASGAVLVLLYGAAFSANVFIFAFKITRVTGGAVGRVFRPRPCQRVMYGAAMACAAARISAVVARIITQRVVAKDVWRPATCGMADVALYGRVYVS